MTDLDRIMELRGRRRDTLKRAEQAAQDMCNVARDRVRRTRSAMDEYAEEVRTLELDLLRELMNTELRKTDFDEFREKLEAAEKKARDLAGRNDEAQKALSKAERAVDRARRDARRVEAKLNRMSQLQKLRREEAADAAIRAQDAESDDIADMLFGRGARR